MSARRTSLLLLCVLAACGDDAEPCKTLFRGEGRHTIALPDLCLREATVRRRAGGAWTADAPRMELTPVDHGVVATLHGGGDSEAFAIELTGLDLDQLHQQGYQSWGFAGTVLVPAAVDRAADGAPAFAAAQSGDPLHEETGVSYHAALLRRGDDGPVLVVGALSAERAVTGIAASRGDDGQTRVEIVYGPTREVLGVPLGPEVESERIFIGSAPDADAALAALGAQLAAAHAGGFTPKRPPGGWFSWNQHFDAIDAAIVQAQLPVMTAKLAPAGLTLVEIDDGWSKAWGDWQDNDKFPGGMEAVGKSITDAGLVAGVWLAPFLVDVTSEAAKRDPSLFVQGADGQPLEHQIAGNNRTFYVLDGTNPESMQIVTDDVKRLADAGFTFFKLDFLYAGALAGERMVAVTGTEALRMGLATIRAAAGPDAIVNACGAPTLPVLGLADSLRIGPDTAFGTFALDWTMVVSAARNLAARSYLFPLIWPDADQAQLREPFTTDEARAGAAVAALAGPAYALGDDLALLPAARLDLGLDAALLDLAAAAAPARPVGLMVAPTDDIPLNPLLEDVRFTGGIATPPPARFVATGASGTVYDVAFDWMDAHSVTVTAR